MIAFKRKRLSITIGSWTKIQSQSQVDIRNDSEKKYLGLAHCIFKDYHEKIECKKEDIHYEK